MEPRAKHPRLSDAALNMIASNTQPQQNINAPIQQHYRAWCTSQKINANTPDVTNIINFLAHQQEIKGWKNQSVLTYLSRLLTLYNLADRIHIYTNPDYQAYITALKANILRPNRDFEYDIQPALDHICSLGPNNSLSPSDATAKTAWLLAMTGFLRPSDLHRIDLDQCYYTSTGLLKLIIVAPKERRGGSPYTKSITISPHNNPLLCPIAAFSSYCQRFTSTPCIRPHTRRSRITLNYIFRNQHDTSLPLSVERIGKYIKSIMDLIPCPIGVKRPSARSLASTRAALAGSTLDDIIAHGSWSSSQTYSTFYRLSSQGSTNFTSATLDQQPSSTSRLVLTSNDTT
jgi:hypothetical protein